VTSYEVPATEYLLVTSRRAFCFYRAGPLARKSGRPV